MKKKYYPVGKHIVADFWGCSFDDLNNKDLLIELMREASLVSSAEVLKVSSKKFKPNGVTVAMLLSESHISVHTYPEFGYAAFDIYTCGRHTNPKKGINFLKRSLNPKRAEIKELKRGMV